MIQFVLQSLKIATIGVMSLLVVLGGSRFFDYYHDKNIPSNAGKTVSVTIKQTDSTDEVAAKLHDKGLIRYEYIFKSLMQVSRKDFVAKTYKLKIGMTTPEIIDAITTGSVKSSSKPDTSADDNKVLTLTIPEGYRTEQIADTLDEIGYKPGGKAFLDAVKKYKSNQFAFLKDRPDKTSLEGYLFPDTYQITANEPPEDIIQKFLQNFDNRVTSDMRSRAKDMGLSLPEVLTLASMVEREAQVPRERQVIADVYINRLEQGWNMESDPTVRYAIGKRSKEKSPWWSAPSADDLLNVDSPFNTYKNGGLPPHAICNPGLDSIQAVLVPGGTSYMYFVANTRDSQDGQISHLFSTSKDDQDLNVAYVGNQADAPAYGSDPFGDGGQLNTGGTADTGGTEAGNTTGEDVPIEQTDGGGG
ncbi:MAG TPA: endolytic transglycosylase MltG [Thermomicrobiales bacterium]